MISLKRYLDAPLTAESANDEPQESDLLTLAVRAYGSALMEMGNCSLEACPGLGDSLKQGLSRLGGTLSTSMTCDAMEAANSGACDQLRHWGHATARHYQQKACEVKELLLTMARTAESVSTRDQRCAGQMHQVTARLQAIASLEDLTEIRTSIERSAAELKTSIDRMTAEGKAVLDQMQQQLNRYQAKLEEAEEMASRDALTGLSSRLSVEGQIEKRLATGNVLCVAILDVDRFKKVNDEHGHMVGDELLKQFGRELRAACRTTDVIGRWGGDEFILLFDCGMDEAEAQVGRLRKWVCGDYTVHGRNGELKLQVEASIGLAERRADESLKGLVERADAAMYADKAAARERRPGSRQPAA